MWKDILRHLEALHAGAFRSCFSPMVILKDLLVVLVHVVDRGSDNPKLIWCADQKSKGRPCSHRHTSLGKHPGSLSQYVWWVSTYVWWVSTYLYFITHNSKNAQPNWCCTQSPSPTVMHTRVCIHVPNIPQHLQKSANVHCCSRHDAELTH